MTKCYDVDPIDQLSPHEREMIICALQAQAKHDLKALTIRTHLWGEDSDVVTATRHYLTGTLGALKKVGPGAYDVWKRWLRPKERALADSLTGEG